MGLPSSLLSNITTTNWDRTSIVLVLRVVGDWNPTLDLCRSRQIAFVEEEEEKKREEELVVVVTTIIILGKTRDGREIEIESVRRPFSSDEQQK